jgi:hypothetical protein
MIEKYERFLLKIIKTVFLNQCRYIAAEATAKYVILADTLYTRIQIQYIYVVNII